MCSVLSQLNISDSPVISNNEDLGSPSVEADGERQLVPLIFQRLTVKLNRITGNNEGKCPDTFSLGSVTA